MATGYIKLHREILEWEWADDALSFALFVRLLLLANSDEGWKWHGMELKAGQLVTSVAKLAATCGMTEKQVRCRLDKFVETGEITRDGFNGSKTLITICNYSKYQCTDNARASFRASFEQAEMPLFTDDYKETEEKKGKLLGKVRASFRASFRASEGQAQTAENEEVVSDATPNEGKVEGKLLGNIQEYNNNISIDNNNSKDSTITMDNNKNILCENLSAKDAEQLFEQFRKAYKGKKRGLQTELENFRKHNKKDWLEIVPLLLPAWERELAHREQAAKQGRFVPEYAMLQTWLNQRRWEMEFETTMQGNGETAGGNSPSGSGADSSYTPNYDEEF